VERGEFTGSVLRFYPVAVDAAIDLVGGATARATFDAVRDGGRYATAVPPYIDPSGPFDSERDITVHVHTVHPDTHRLAELLTLAADRELPTPVEQHFSLDDAAGAHRRQAAGGLAGRILLIP
jgi:NADPH2:quinone reductase